jgi:hypothetical protein
MEKPITGYRVFFPDAPPEDFIDVDSAWSRRNYYIDQTGKIPYVHPLREGGPGYPTLD